MEYEIKGASFLSAFMLYKSATRFFNMFSDESVGKVIKSVCNYIYDGIEPSDLQETEIGLFNAILESANKASKDYVENKRANMKRDCDIQTPTCKKYSELLPM